MPKASNLGEDAVGQFCDVLLSVVVAAIHMSGRKIVDLDQASAVMRAEAKEFLFGPTYANERECVRLGTVNPQYVLTSVAASCVSKINTTPK